MHLQDNSLQDHLWGKRGHSNGFVARTRSDCTAALHTGTNPYVLRLMSCMQWVSVAEPLLQRNTVSALKTFLQCYYCTLIIICSFLQDFDPLTVKRTNMVVQPLRLQRHRKGGMNTTGNNSRGGRSKEKHLRFHKAHVRNRKWKNWVVLTGLTLSFTSLQSLLWLLPSPHRGVK